MTGVSSRYRVLRRLGQGGMAEVFEAERVGELGFVRKVALKQLRPDAVRDPMAARRFIDETRIASQLHHAHIVAVLDVGVLDDRPFQVLELVDGLDADELIRRAGGALPPELALMLAHAVAHALDHAHTATGADGRRLGIVHRDVKPPNILIAWTGDVKLADFGIAVAHDRVAHTETGLVAGTRGFLAPEQRMRGQLDGRSDVFALGLTLHALCTGKTPLADLEAEVRLLGGEPLVLDPALPADVHALITRAVAPDRLARPTAAVLAAAIGDVLAARGSRDARTALRDFLTPLRRPPRAAGALDFLLGIELVPVDDPDASAAPSGAAGTVQLYAAERPPAPLVPTASIAAPRAPNAAAMSPSATPRDADAAPRVPNVAAPRDADAAPRAPDVAAPLDDGAAPTTATAEPPRPSVARRRVLAIAVAAVVVAAAALALRAPAAQTPVPAAPALAMAMRVADAGSPGPDVDVADASRSAVTPPLPAVPHAADAGAADAARANPPRPAPVAIATHVAAPGHHHALTPAATAPAPATDPSARGYIQVVGEDLLRARVLIDGVAVGYVPNRFAVALGHHRIEVERPDGVRLPPRELEVTGFHTAQRPARPSW